MRNSKSDSDETMSINASTNTSTTTPATDSHTNHSLESISEYITQELSERRGRSIPPLDKWHPEREGEMDLVIKANGEWWHEGSNITRQSLMDLFSTVLWSEKEDDSVAYFLKTPVEKIRIRVEDVPFLINQVNVVDKDENKDENKDQNKVIEFITSTGDVIYLDDDHPLEMATFNGEQRPYIHVRFGMKGLIARNVFMHLTKLGEMAEQDGTTTLTLVSNGKTYTVSVTE